MVIKRQLISMLECVRDCVKISLCRSAVIERLDCNKVCIIDCYADRAYMIEQWTK